MIRSTRSGGRKKRLNEKSNFISGCGCGSRDSLQFSFPPAGQSRWGSLTQSDRPVIDLRMGLKPGRNTPTSNTTKLVTQSSHTLSLFPHSLNLLDLPPLPRASYLSLLSHISYDILLPYQTGLLLRLRLIETFDGALRAGSSWLLLTHCRHLLPTSPLSDNHRPQQLSWFDCKETRPVSQG